MKKGFTLIELLIVIAILAILATVVVLVLNPAQLLAESRDGQRLSDMSTLNTALALYSTTASSPDLDGTGALACATDCFTNIGGMAANCGGRHAVARETTTDTDRTVDGTGWIPVVLTDTSGGAPISVLPIDPSQSTTYFYSYACDNTAKTWELDANLESTRYSNGGGDDKESTDGGSVTTVYEIGNDSGLDL
jgi:prepilin-type N-terminal cleavage/methylation domain-containing protein